MIKEDSLVWSVYNERQGIQIDQLSFEQAWKIVASSDSKTRVHWLLWHEGLTSWRSVSDFEGSEDFLRQVHKIPFTFPAVPSEEDRRRAEEEREIGVFDFQDTNVAINLDDSRLRDDRAHRRFRQRYLVEIEVGEGRFTTHTADISLGGMRLEDPLPPSVAGPFQARLIQESGTGLIVKCGLVDPHELDRERVRFMLTEEKIEILRTWLLEHPLGEDD